MPKLLTQTFEITEKVGKESVTIQVTIDAEDTVTIDTHDKKRQLAFTRSNKDRVIAMGLAITHAGELVDNLKVTAG